MYMYIEIVRQVRETGINIVLHVIMTTVHEPSIVTAINP